MEHAIEDWILDDIEGLCRYLGIIDIPSSLPGASGVEKLSRLFRKKNQLYIKGYNIKNIIPYLDMGKIRDKRISSLTELEGALEFKM